MIDILLKVNEIFDNHINNIKGNFRQKILTIKDALLFRMKYAEIGVTKDTVAADINYEANINCDATVFTKKEKNIPVSFYESLYEDIKTLYNKHFTNKNYFKSITIEPLKDLHLVGIDGTYSNTNIEAKKGELETSLNMCAYDITHGLPLFIDLKGKEKKNKEVECLYEYLKENKLEKNTIIVADRAYMHYELFRKLDNMSMKYVIRLKDNSLIGKKKSKNNDILTYLNENARVIDYEFEQIKNLPSRNNKLHTVKIKTKCKLLTNLIDSNKYSDEIIRDIYKRRWDIEVFFKLLKSNFKFRTSTERNPVNYAKQYFSELIILYISKMLIRTKTTYFAKQRKLNKLKCINKKNGRKVKCKIRFNESLIIKGIFNKLLRNIVYSTLTINILNSFMEIYIKIKKNETDRHFDHISKTPYSKWYVKYYHDLYKYIKVINAIQNNDFDKLNKNLKLLYKNITIIK